MITTQDAPLTVIFPSRGAAEKALACSRYVWEHLPVKTVWMNAQLFGHAPTRQAADEFEGALVALETALKQDKP